MKNLLGIIGSPRKEMTSHGKWLIGRRDEFLRQRERLKEAVKPYLGGEFL